MPPFFFFFLFLGYLRSHDHPPAECRNLPRTLLKGLHTSHDYYVLFLTVLPVAEPLEVSQPLRVSYMISQGSYVFHSIHPPGVILVAHTE